MCLHMTEHASHVQVDEALEVLAMTCHLGTAALISQHHTALLSSLKPAPDALHTLVDLASFCHLLLPWQMLQLVCAEAATGQNKMVQACDLGVTALQASEHLQHMTSNPSVNCMTRQMICEISVNLCSLP